MEYQVALVIQPPYPLIPTALFSPIYTFPDCVSGPLSSYAICDSTKDTLTRATSLVELFSTEELVANSINTSPGVPRFGLPPYEWWSEALHGVSKSPGVTFAPSGNFSYATSFPQPILMSATFDDNLIEEVASVISTEARAFNNAGRAGLNFWTPNINPFRDPRWGRGQETPGEDVVRIAGYVKSLVKGLQGTPTHESPWLKTIATCKHYSGYDLDNWQGVERYEFDAKISRQDLLDYYLPPFQACVRDGEADSVMCSYNSVNGVPACADRVMLDGVLRNMWGLKGHVVSDCDAIENVYADHHFTGSWVEAVAESLKAGTDLDCGPTYGKHLSQALNESLIEVEHLQKALIRQYSSLIRAGYFDPPESQPYRKLTWEDVNTPYAQKLAYQSAVDGIILLKNDGVLPIKCRGLKISLIGPWANATTQMQGNYFGVAPYLISPLQGLTNAGYSVEYALGTNITSSTLDGHHLENAIKVARKGDIIIFAGGIDNTIEKEELDRQDIEWPSNQISLLNELSRIGKPLVIVQFGGGQLDNAVLKDNPAVSAILWAGYPGQSGGTAIADIVSGKASPAGRLPVTQYPAKYTSQIPMTDMSLRASETSPGRTYRYYTGNPVYEFGFGLHYSTFDVRMDPNLQYSNIVNIQQLLDASAMSTSPDLIPLLSLSIDIENTGLVTSDYVPLLFIVKQGGDGPKKQLAAYSRIRNIEGGKTTNFNLNIKAGSVFRFDEEGNTWLEPGTYNFMLDVPSRLSGSFYLTGTAVKVMDWIGSI